MAGLHRQADCEGAGPTLKPGHSHAAVLNPIRLWCRRHAIALTAGLLSTTIGLASPEAVRQWELGMSDAFQVLRGSRQAPQRLLIVAIDDHSLQEAANSDLLADPRLQGLQHWPWPRRIYSLILDRLFAAGASTVGVDLLFDTPSSHGDQDDQSFARGLRRHAPSVVLGTHVIESQGSVAELSLNPPIEALRTAVGPERLGLLNGFQEGDSTIRQRPSQYAHMLQSRLGGETLVSLSDAVLRASGQPVAARPAPAHTQTLLEFYGPPGTIETIPVWKLLEQRSYADLKASRTLQGRLVLLGPTGALLQDLHSTPFAGAEGMAGVEIHATELANRLDGRAISAPLPSRSWAVLLGLIVAGLCLSAERWERPLARLGWMAGLALLTLLTSFGLIQTTGHGLPLVSVSLGLLLGGVMSGGEATLRLQLQRLRLRQNLERYLSPAVAAEVVRQDGSAHQLLGGKSVEAVIMMTDIRGFTAYTQAMSARGQERELVARLNEYFTEVVEALHEHGGTVDKFIGDATLSIFGAPLNRGSSIEADQAVRAALAIDQRLQALNHRWQAAGMDPWAQVITLSFGTVISGNIGSQSRMDYTVIGDAVNTASRLEGVAKQHGHAVVLSESVAELIRNSWPILDLGVIELRGQKPQHVFALNVAGTSGQPG